MRFVLQIAGVALILAGGLWTLQGLGIVKWPADSFMLADESWAVKGLIAVAIGAGLLWLGARRRG